MAPSMFFTLIFLLGFLGSFLRKIRFNISNKSLGQAQQIIHDLQLSIFSSRDDISNILLASHRGKLYNLTVDTSANLRWTILVNKNQIYFSHYVFENNNLKLVYERKLTCFDPLDSLKSELRELSDVVGPILKTINRKRIRQNEEQMRQELESKSLKNKLLQEKLSEVKVSDELSDYLISEEDYKRGTRKELEYFKRHKFTLFRLYGNKCAKCSADDNGVDIDHFFIPKSLGGNFILKNNDGHLVNNAIPLCCRCNRSKSAKNYKAFFSEEQLLLILTKNVEMTKRINNKG